MSKKPLFLLAILIACSFIFSANAQMNTSIGLKGGGNFATFIGNDVDGAKALPGGYGGFVVRLTEADNEFLKYVFQAELFYSMQGAKQGSDKVTLSYVNLPVTIQRYFGQSSFFLETGPQVGFLVSAKEKTSLGTVDIKKQTRPVDFSLNLGVGYLTNSGLGINTRVNIGVTSYSKDYDAHNAVASLGLFYVFGYGAAAE